MSYSSSPLPVAYVSYFCFRFIIIFIIAHKTPNYQRKYLCIRKLLFTDFGNYLCVVKIVSKEDIVLLFLQGYHCLEKTNLLGCKKENESWCLSGLTTVL